MIDFSRDYIADDVPFRLASGARVRYDVHYLSRGGSKSESLWLIKIDGKWRTPFEMRVRYPDVYHDGLQTALHVCYPKALLQEELMKPHPTLFNLIPKDDAWKGGTLVIPMKP